MKILLLVIILLFNEQALTCTTMSTQDSHGNTIVMKSFDFHSESGYLFVNKKNVKKRSLTTSWSIGKSWVSHYGSITFNQISRNFPYGGINEAGLNMEIMWLDETLYPEANKRTVNESQIIQYVLDLASSTDEALDLIDNISIVPIMAKVHYMVCDKFNECATVEYLNGKKIINKLLPNKERILQNSVYQNMQERIRSGYGSERQTDEELVQIFSTPLDSESFTYETFNLLDIVKQGNFTVWQIAYDLNSGKVAFKTRDADEVKFINLNDIEFDCRKDQNEYVLNMNDNNSTGDIRNFLSEYSKNIDTQLLSQFSFVSDTLKRGASMYQQFFHSCTQSYRKKRRKL